jgi:hypothetical protein
MPRAKTAPVKKTAAAAKTAPASRKPATKPRTTKSSKTSTSQPAPRTMKQAGADAFASSKHLLHAGLTALSLSRAESAVADGLSKITDSVGFKKLEDVFDQRVASALQRIGIPSADELARLIEKVDTLSALVKSTKTRK